VPIHHAAVDRDVPLATARLLYRSNASGSSVGKSRPSLQARQPVSAWADHLTENLTSSSSMASMAAARGRQIPCSVIMTFANPDTTRRLNHLKDRSHNSVIDVNKITVMVFAPFRHDHLLPATATPSRQQPSLSISPELFSRAERWPTKYRLT
jgi:hypothetical protein